MKPTKKITITVSGLSGSGKTYVAKYISNKLGLKYYSSGKIFREFARKDGNTLEEFCKIRKPSIDKKVDREALKVIRKGNAVIDGRLSGWIAGNSAFKIYVSCPLRIRAERVAKRDNISKEEAMKRLRIRDESDRKKYLETYGIDMLDKSIYDKVIDNSVSESDLKRELNMLLRKIKKTI
ncbi:MAG: cytidylate kinase family protein [Candidatus Aenigmatarchaeota archaeon]